MKFKIAVITLSMVCAMNAMANEVTISRPPNLPVKYQLAHRDKQGVVYGQIQTLKRFDNPRISFRQHGNSPTGVVIVAVKKPGKKPHLGKWVYLPQGVRHFDQGTGCWATTDAEHHRNKIYLKKSGDKIACIKQ